MKAIIDGLRYDTDKAELVYHWTNGHYTSDFYYKSVAIYKTEKNSWFAHHEGGAASDVCSHHGNSTGWGEMIEPLTYDDAYSLLEKYGASDEIEEHFPENITDA